MRRDTRGVARIEWVPDPGVRNEPLDCRVYATTALHGLYAAILAIRLTAPHPKKLSVLPINQSGRYGVVSYPTASRR